MLAAGAALAAGLLAMAAQTFRPFVDPWFGLLAGWAVLGTAYSAVLTPSGRLLRRSARPDDRSALFAAQFALSHAGWLVTYLVAGLLGARAGLGWTLTALGGLAGLGVAVAIWVWPKSDPEILPHDPDDLSPDHPHLAGGGRRHAHDFVIDDLHPGWPRAGF